MYLWALYKYCLGSADHVLLFFSRIFAVFLPSTVPLCSTGLAPILLQSAAARLRLSPSLSLPHALLLILIHPHSIPRSLAPTRPAAHFPLLTFENPHHHHHHHSLPPQSSHSRCSPDSFPPLPLALLCDAIVAAIAAATGATPRARDPAMSRLRLSASATHGVRGPCCTDTPTDAATLSTVAYVCALRCKLPGLHCVCSSSYPHGLAPIRLPTRDPWKDPKTPRPGQEPTRRDAASRGAPLQAVSRHPLWAAPPLANPRAVNTPCKPAAHHSHHSRVGSRLSRAVGWSGHRCGAAAPARYVSGARTPVAPQLLIYGPEEPQRCLQFVCITSENGY